MSPAERLEQHRRINQRPVPCPRCKRTKRGVTQGQITLSDKVPVRLQEKG